ncbi:MAG: zinc finger domain-containing protein [Candidatus Acidiferrales bacterium]
MPEAPGVEAVARSLRPLVRGRKIRACRIAPQETVILDQTRIAGIGNIYSSESLWHAHLDPRRRVAARRNSPPPQSRCFGSPACFRMLPRPAARFSRPEWWFAGLDRILAVYGREGEPCRRCGCKIRRVEQGGRSTYFCPRCQT